MTSKVSLMLVAVVALACIGFTGCTQQKPDSPAAAEKADASSLYVRLGGQPAIRKVVDNFTANLAADDRLNKRFAKTDMRKLKESLVQQLCELSGGPEVYTGKDMKSAHRGMQITEPEWNAFMDDLVKTLNDMGIPAQEKEELLVKLTPMKSDVVGQ